MLRKELLCTYPITFLQDKLHGIMSGDMIMIAASTGVGKSTLSRIIVNHAISEDCPAVLFSLEDEPQTYATDSVYKEYLKQAFEPLDFREWLLDYSDNPKKYEEFAKIAALKAVNEIKGLQSCKVYEMKTPNWSLEEIINLITKH